ncbi:MAG: TlpA family protein disulfide reductase [Betaproteobacteria bacterium]|nr:TlpA family protein disulfide reductase [Betaproteobacteria bacterium]
MNFPAEPRAPWRAFLAGWPGLIALGLALVLGGAALLRWTMPPESKHADKLGRERDPGPIMAATYPDLRGQTQALKQWAGRVIVVNFWATWCGPCREEIPDLIALHTQFAQEPVTIVGIAIDQAEAVRGYVAEFGVNYPILIGGFTAVDIARAAGNQYGVLPFTVVIDRQGGIAEAHLGRVPGTRLAAMVRAAL